jgi:hypothetical protein
VSRHNAGLDTGPGTSYDFGMLPRENLPRPLRPFIDAEGRLHQWPSRQKVQRMAAAFLARRFEPGRDYTEPEVNLLLMDGHTFADWALLRRVLYDWGFLDRESNGSRYWVRPDAAERIAEQLPGPSPI